MFQQTLSEGAGSAKKKETTTLIFFYKISWTVEEKLNQNSLKMNVSN